MPKWIRTKDGSYTLWHEAIDELYHSRSGAWSACQNVFLRPFIDYSALSRGKKWAVLDLGFGIGMNWLCYVDFFLHRCTPTLFYGDEEMDKKIRDLERQKHIEIISIEIDAKLLTVSMTPRRLGHYPIYNKAFELLKRLKKDKFVEAEHITARLLVGDAVNSLQTLAKEGWKFDIVLQDPFSPRKNPECWTPEYFRLVAACCKTGTMLLTYSVATEICRILKEAGFVVRKIQGFGDKKEQLVAVFRKENP